MRTHKKRERERDFKSKSQTLLQKCLIVECKRLHTDTPSGCFVKRVLDCVCIEWVRRSASVMSSSQNQTLEIRYDIRAYNSPTSRGKLRNFAGSRLNDTLFVRITIIVRTRQNWSALIAVALYARTLQALANLRYRLLYLYNFDSSSCWFTITVLFVFGFAFFFFYDTRGYQNIYNYWNQINIIRFFNYFCSVSTLLHPARAPL